MTDDGVSAFGDDDSGWRWHWRAPWTSEAVSPTTFKSEATALSAGRRWLAQQQHPDTATAARGARPPQTRVPTRRKGRR
jgi:hypothetical protein